ncbi:MAG TPA: hypothetical protein VD973_15550 [Symbiobacteriaceae bacterium]|nr:hypothetical protein [Symbiobacteriaceae bacterium]
MDRARSVLKVGALGIGVVILALLLTTSLHEELRFAGIIDFVWKVLLLLLLADISMKLGHRR